jgi:hypothetical protein
MEYKKNDIKNYMINSSGFNFECSLSEIFSMAKNNDINYTNVYLPSPARIELLKEFLLMGCKLPPIYYFYENSIKTILNNCLFSDILAIEDEILDDLHLSIKLDVKRLKVNFIQVNPKSDASILYKKLGYW